MTPDDLATLRHVATEFRTAIERARAERAPAALPYFPDGACRLVSRLLARHLRRHPEFRHVVHATHLASGLVPGSRAARHVWLELDDTVVDLTADAFGLAPVIVGPATSFHETLEGREREPVDQDIAATGADDEARLTRQLAAIEERIP